MKHRHTFAWCVMCASLHQFQIVCINVNYFYHFSIYCLCSRAAWNCICKWYFILLLLDYRNQITFSTRRKKKYSHNSKRKWNRKIDNKMHRKTTELNCLQRDSRRWMDQPQPYRHNRISIHSGKRKKQIILFLYFSFSFSLSHWWRKKKLFFGCFTNCVHLVVSFVYHFFLIYTYMLNEMLATKQSEKKAKVDENFIYAMRDTFWMFSIGLSSEIVNAVNIVIAFCAIMWPSHPFIGFVWAISIWLSSRHWFWCQFVLIVRWFGVLCAIAQKFRIHMADYTSSQKSQCLPYVPLDWF